jgi:hypothetical protein
MSVMPQLERDLVEAAKRRKQAAAARAGLARLRLPFLAAGCLLASATIALAAGGVIPVGVPVKPRQPLNPDAGEGLPLAGGSRLLPLRVPDPYGGVPWGMRVVRTTRGEVCVQIGRVQGGQLGELGIDGAFRDDGLFHPIPADAQAEYFKDASKEAANGFAPIGGCQLIGTATANQAIGDDRNAGVGETGSLPPSDMRTIDWGLLGPQAVSVRYGAGSQAHTVSVVPGLGAYLLVQRTLHPAQAGYGGGSIGKPGLLPAGAGIAAITYRIDGKLCERGASTGPYRDAAVSHPCPTPHWPKNTEPPRNLRLPIHVRLQIHDRFVTGVQVSFAAPFAVSSARHHYAAEVPAELCKTAPNRGVTGYSGETLERDVPRGATIRFDLSDPFGANSRCHPRSKTIRIVYETANGGGGTIVGTAKVSLPAGTKPAPVNWPHAAHHRSQRADRAAARR